MSSVSKWIERLESTAIMASGIAHDFNNLLNIILSNAEILQATHPAQTLIGQHLQHIVNATQQAVDLVRQLLSFAGQQPSALQYTNLNQLIDERWFRRGSHRWDKTYESN